MFKANEGPVDRIVRALIGIALIVVALLFLSTTLKIVAIVVGAVLVFTAISGFCGLYVLLGINTCPIKREE